MEGVIATWYTKNTGRDLRRFDEAARAVSARVAPGGRVLEVAPGPGYLAVELAKRGYQVAAVDISASFVRIVGEHAKAAGVTIDVRQGDAAALPFDAGTFDCVVCMAAFKNFTDPMGAIDEMHRVLRPGGQASIYDLRKDAARTDIEAEVRDMRLSAFNAFLTRWTFRHMLLKSAYTLDQIERMARESRFGGGTVTRNGIGFELRLTR
ncbi:MAG TPA: class I SAM-dependent methyltransferase [Haliangiales bacterium]|nr:class I SAM-dependent methyltransferase [Haliangiales bacterium]